MKKAWGRRLGYVGLVVALVQKDRKMSRCTPDRSCGVRGRSQTWTRVFWGRLPDMIRARTVRLRFAFWVV